MLESKLIALTETFEEPNEIEMERKSENELFLEAFT